MTNCKTIKIKGMDEDGGKEPARALRVLKQCLSRDR